jgi:hypothetical protein
MDAIHRDVGHLLLRRTLFNHLHDIRAKNPDLLRTGNPFFAFLGELFVDSVVVGIRRHLKKDENCLVRLLQDLTEPPGLPLRSGGYLDVATPTSDIDELKRIASACEDYADKRIAHLDPRGPDMPAPQEVYDALDALERMIKKYFLLLHGGSIDIEPHLLVPFDDAFTFPWRPDLAALEQSAPK